MERAPLVHRALVDGDKEKPTSAALKRNPGGKFDRQKNTPRMYPAIRMGRTIRIAHRSRSRDQAPERLGQLRGEAGGWIVRSPNTAASETGCARPNLYPLAIGVGLAGPSRLGLVVSTAARWTESADPRTRCLLACCYFGFFLFGARADRRVCVAVSTASAARRSVVGFSRVRPSTSRASRRILASGSSPMPGGG